MSVFPTCDWARRTLGTDRIPAAISPWSHACSRVSSFASVPRRSRGYEEFITLGGRYRVT